MALLRVTSTILQGESFSLDAEYYTLGRDSDNTIRLSHTSVSKHHAMITVDKGDYKLWDLHSTNGLIINGEKTVIRHLKDGDKIVLGDVELKFEANGQSPTQPPSKPEPTASETQRVSLVPPIPNKPSLPPPAPKTEAPPPPIPPKPIIVPKAETQMVTVALPPTPAPVKPPEPAEKPIIQAPKLELPSVPVVPVPPPLPAPIVLKAPEPSTPAPVKPPEPEIKPIIPVPKLETPPAPAPPPTLIPKLEPPPAPVPTLKPDPIIAAPKLLPVPAPTEPKPSVTSKSETQDIVISSAVKPDSAPATQAPVVVVPKPAPIKVLTHSPAAPVVAELKPAPATPTPKLEAPKPPVPASPESPIVPTAPSPPRSIKRKISLAITSAGLLLLMVGYGFHVTPCKFIGFIIAITGAICLAFSLRSNVSFVPPRR